MCCVHTHPAWLGISEASAAVLSGVLAAKTASTRVAPLASRALAAAFMVLPVVITSSTIHTRSPLASGEAAKL